MGETATLSRSRVEEQTEFWNTGLTTP